MKDFKSISEHDLLKEAYYSILSKWDKETRLNEQFNKEHGRNSSIAEHRIVMYGEQLAEIHERIIEIERA